MKVPVGWTLMEAAKQANLAEIPAYCGGCCACGTCHIYVHPNDFDKLIDKEDDEILTLESLANDPNQYSRLSCQIVFKKEYIYQYNS